MKEQYVMYNGVTTLVEVPDNEEFNPNDHIPAEGDVVVPFSASSANEDFDKSQFVAEQLTDDNTFKPGTKSWYKHELDSFQGVTYDDRMTIKELHEKLLQAHGVKD